MLKSFSSCVELSLVRIDIIRSFLFCGFGSHCLTGRRHRAARTRRASPTANETMSMLFTLESSFANQLRRRSGLTHKTTAQLK